MSHRFYKVIRQQTRFIPLRLLSIFASFCLMLSFSVYASPGAHGPNGEHIEVAHTKQQTQQPKFETFTESFELLGEVFEQQINIYLHDFETNVVVKSADIELQSGSISASASFDSVKNLYKVTNTDFIAKLNNSGEHEIIVTVLTQDSGDLLVANFLMPEAQSAQAQEHTSQHEHEQEHHHFPWWILALSLGVFIVGFVLGRRNKGVKS